MPVVVLPLKDGSGIRTSQTKHAQEKDCLHSTQALTGERCATLMCLIVINEIVNSLKGVLNFFVITTTRLTSCDVGKNGSGSASSPSLTGFPINPLDPKVFSLINYLNAFVVYN